MLALGSEQVQNPMIATDQQGGLHVVYERSTEAGQQARYKRWRPTYGWDFRPTSVSDETDGSVSRAQLLPVSNGGLTVLYSGFDGLRDRQRARRRRLDGNLAADVESAARAVVAFACLPNPARAGQTLRFAGSALRPGEFVDVLDAAGRRVAAQRVGPTGEAHLGAAETGALAPGLYFAHARASHARARLVVVR